MDVRILLGLVGTLIGVTAAVAIAFFTQRTLQRRELVREEMGQRQSLYSEFISECARLFVHAFQHSLENPDTFVPVFSLINRIRLCASRQVLAEAELLLGRITEQYFSDNLSLEELRELARSGDADPLKPFGIACRAELESVRARV